MTQLGAARDRALTNAHSLYTLLTLHSCMVWTVVRCLSAAGLGLVSSGRLAGTLYYPAGP